MAEMADRLTGLKQRVAEADRSRAQAEAKLQLAQERLAEIDERITALGIKPEKAEAELAKLEEGLQKELDAIDAALQTEQAAYQQILAAS